MAGLAAAVPGFEAHRAKMVVEARPAWSGKAQAVADRMARPPFRGRRPVVIGEDRTVEPAFSVAHGVGGIAVKAAPAPRLPAGGWPIGRRSGRSWPVGGAAMSDGHRLIVVCGGQPMGTP